MVVVGGRVVVVIGGRVVVVDDEVDDVVDVLVVVAGVLSSFEAFTARMISTTATATIKIATAHRSGLRAGLGPVAASSGGVPAGGAPAPAAVPAGGGVTGLG